MKHRTGQVRKIATAERDADSRAWNTTMVDDDARITFATLDKDHAQELADLINSCAWVTVLKRSDR